jgi:hypothetical protein
MRHIHLTILGLALSLASGLPAAGCLTINSLNFNSGYVIQLVNDPSSVNPNAALNILTAQVVNNTGSVIPANTQAVTINLTEPANPDNCSGAQIISTVNLLVSKALPVGPSTLVATNFKDAGNNNVQVCPAFQSDIENQFKSINPDNANVAITKFLQRRFQVTLGDGCSQASTFITIFNQSAASKVSPAQLLMPRDGSTVTDPLPLFLWTPAVAAGTTQGIDYELILSLSDGGTPLPNGGTISRLPSGQLFYKWQSSDPELPTGKVYWRVRALDHASHAQLGNDSRSSSFTYAPVGASGNCGYSLSELDAYARQALADRASLLDGLSLQRVDIITPAGGPPANSLADPDVCALLGQAGGSSRGKVHLLNLTVTRR